MLGAVESATGHTGFPSKHITEKVILFWVVRSPSKSSASSSSTEKLLISVISWHSAKK
jgi:hypothetical protein